MRARGVHEEHRPRPLRTTRQSSRTQRLLGPNPVGLLMVAPAVVLFLLVGALPIVVSAFVSFTTWNGITDPEFIGLENYRRLLWKEGNLRTVFWDALWHNVIFAVVVTTSVVVISLTVAFALNSITRGMGLFRSALLLPMVTSGIAIYFTWIFLFSPFGPLNEALRSIGLDSLAPQRGWLGEPNLALPALSVVLIWVNVPLATLIYLAGLQTFNPELLEAAQIDGANWFHRLRFIIWPLLRPMTLIIVTLNLVVVFQSYELVYLMTNGGPTNRTTVVGLLAFNLAFGGIGGFGGELGMASAVGWIMFVLVLALTAVMARTFRPRDDSR